MPLDASVTRFIGRRVRVVTVPGHGWIDKDHSPVAPLPEFFVTVARFWSFRDERRGGIGQVLQPGRPADELWLVFSVRSQSLHDFDTNPCAYNLILMNREPDDPVDTGSPWAHACYTTWTWAGFGSLRAEV
jgi:hypothetical protein